MTSDSVMASSGPFKVGLFDIGLNIEKNLNSHYLFIEDKQLTNYLEIEPICMKPAIYNLQAVLLFNMDSRRRDARLKLAKLNEEYPNNLNILADLTHIYKNMGCKSDSEKYEKELKKYRNDRLLRAESILGQASALTYDLPDDHNKTPKTHLKEAWKLLNVKDEAWKLHNKEDVNKANGSIMRACRVVETIPETAHEKKIQAKEKAIEKYEFGIRELEELKRPKEEILVWKHNLAIARSRLETWRNKRGDDKNSRSDNCIKTLEAHLDVIEGLSETEEEPLRRYVAKSYVYFAQLYGNRKHTMILEDIPERIKKPNVESYIEKGRDIFPDDQIVLQRYGRYLANKEEYLSAIEIYNRSIDLIKDIYLNWFSYSSRRDAFLFYSKKLMKDRSNQGEIDKYLRLAYDDGKLCLQSKCTEICMMRFADICFQRARPVNSDISYCCEHLEFIYEALEILNEALNKRDVSKDGKIYNECGKCYPYIGEYRKAIESMKTALELNKWSKKFSVFFCLSKCFVVFYTKENDKNLLSEFRFLLKEAKNRKCDYWVTEAIDKIKRNNREMLTDLVQNMIEWDIRGCKTIIEEALDKYKYDLSDLREQFKKKLKEPNNEESEINGPRQIKKSVCAEISDYDFYVSHAEKDSDWVDCMLRPQLEEFDDVIKFRGCIPDRDFIPGESIIDSMIDGLKKSDNLLMVLTPDYLKDHFEKYVTDQMILSYIHEGKNIIPIILKSCDIPRKLEIFTPINFTKESDWERLRMGLTCKESETGLAEDFSKLTIQDS